MGFLSAFTGAAGAPFKAAAGAFGMPQHQTPPQQSSQAGAAPMQGSYGDYQQNYWAPDRDQVLQNMQTSNPNGSFTSIQSFPGAGSYSGAAGGTSQPSNSLFQMLMQRMHQGR